MASPPINLQTHGHKGSEKGSAMGMGAADGEENVSVSLCVADISACPLLWHFVGHFHPCIANLGAVPENKMAKSLTSSPLCTQREVFSSKILYFSLHSRENCILILQIYCFLVLLEMWNNCNHLKPDFRQN